MKALPNNPRALNILFDEVKSIVDQLHTLHMMLGRCAYLLQEIEQRGENGPEAATVRYLEEQRKALACHIAGLRYPGATFLDYMPKTILADIMEALRSFSLVGDRSGANSNSRMTRFQDACRRLLAGLKPLKELQQEIWERMTAIDADRSIRLTCDASPTYGQPSRSGLPGGAETTVVPGIGTSAAAPFSSSPPLSIPQIRIPKTQRP